MRRRHIKKFLMPYTLRYIVRDDIAIYRDDIKDLDESPMDIRMGLLAPNPRSLFAAAKK